MTLLPWLVLVAAGAWYWRRVRPRIKRLEANAATVDAALRERAAELQWVRDVRAAIGLGIT